MSYEQVKAFRKRNPNYHRDWTRRNRAGLTTCRKYRKTILGLRIGKDYLAIVRRVLA